MISIIKYEFKKILSNVFLLILITVLILANLFFVGNNITKEYIEEKNGITTFINDYVNDPIETNKYVKNYISKYNEIMQIKASDPSIQISFPENKYTNNDYNFFTKDIDNYINFTSSYKSKIKNAIRVAQGHKYEYEEINKAEATENFNFEIAYQDQIIKKYNELKELDFPIIDIKGYDIFLFYNGIGVFLIIAMVIGGIIILIPEYNTGAMSIIRVTKNGRHKTIISKIIVAFIYCLIICILFNLSSLLLIGIKIGFDGGNAPIQMIQEPFAKINGRSFIFCPFDISIIDGVLLKLFLNFIASFVIIITTLCLALILKSYIITFAFSLGYIGFNFVLGNYSFLNDYNYFKNVNLFWAINGIEPIIYYRGINVFGNSIPTLETLLVTDLIILLVAIITTILFFTKSHLNIKKIKIRKLSIIFKLNKTKKKKSQHNIFTYELKKVYSVFTIIVIIVLIISNVALSVSTYLKKPSNTEIAYSLYMKNLEGEWSVEKSDYIENEYSFLKETILSYQDTIKKFHNKEISPEEITKYFENYNKALTHIDAIKELMNKNNELKRIVSNGGKAYFVNEYNWALVYNNNYSYIYLLAIILIISNVFAIEYKEGQINAISITKYYSKTIKSKIIITISSAVLLLGISELIQYLFIILFKGLNCGNATSYSITALSKYGEISLNSLFVLVFLKQMLIIVVFSLLVLILSKITKKLISTLLISSVIAFAPSLFVYFGFDFMNNFSLINYLGRI